MNTATTRRAPLDSYEEVQPLLRYVRVMRRFLNEVIDGDPELRPLYAQLDVAYGEILNQELASNAFALALALTELEDAFPAIREAVRDDDEEDDGE